MSARRVAFLASSSEQTGEVNVCVIKDADAGTFRGACLLYDVVGGTEDVVDIGVGELTSALQARRRSNSVRGVSGVRGSGRTVSSSSSSWRPAAFTGRFVFYAGC